MLLYKSNQQAHIGEVDFSVTYSLTDGKGILWPHGLMSGIVENSAKICLGMQGLQSVNEEGVLFSIWLHGCSQQVPSPQTQNHLDINLSKNSASIAKGFFPLGS